MLFFIRGNTTLNHAKSFKVGEFTREKCSTSLSYFLHVKKSETSKQTIQREWFWKSLFNGITITSKSLLYFIITASHTGDIPRVAWSQIMRLSLVVWCGRAGVRKVCFISHCHDNLDRYQTWDTFLPQNLVSVNREFIPDLPRLLSFLVLNRLHDKNFDVILIVLMR